MEKEQRQQDKEQGSGENSRFSVNKEVSGSSRYSNPENLRTGSRYSAQKTEQETKDTDKNIINRIHWKQIPFKLRLKEKDPVSMALTGVIALVVLAYIIVAVYFSTRFYPGTTIYGINCAAKTADWVHGEVNAKISSYKLSVEERDGKNETIDAAQVGLTYKDEGAIEKRLHTQKSVIWPIMMLIRRGSQTSIETVYDETALENTLKSMVCFQPDSVIAPRDAYIGATDTCFEVVEEELGNTLNYGEVLKVVKEALNNGDETVSLEMEACYEWPKVYYDDPELQAEVEARNAVLGADLTLDFSDRQERINAEKIMDFMVPSANGGYYVNDEKVRGYVSELADRYDTRGKMRTFYTTLGTVETLYDGDYGWTMDQEATAQLILKGIRDKEIGTIEPIYVHTAKCRDTNDIGGTYVEICISQQEMWCYQDGVLMVDTPVVTGNPNKDNATPSGGCWAVDDKQREFILVGPDYRTPVDYWIPFNGGVGIHDLKARAYFGSTIYLTNGSHGCVNTPLDAVAMIYDIVSVGTPVIVYE